MVNVLNVQFIKLYNYSVFLFRIILSFFRVLELWVGPYHSQKPFTFCTHESWVLYLPESLCQNNVKTRLHPQPLLLLFSLSASLPFYYPYKRTGWYNVLVKLRFTCTIHQFRTQLQNNLIEMYGKYAWQIMSASSTILH